MATLRNPYDAVDNNLTGAQVEGLQSSDMGQFGKAWTSGRIGNEINPLAIQEADLRAAAEQGDPRAAAQADALRQQITGLQQRQQMYASNVGRVEDINWSPGRAVDWGLTQMGQGAASMLDPVAASTALSAVGGLAGRSRNPLAQAVSLGAKGLAMGVPAYMSQRQQAGETYNAMTEDPALMARTTATERLHNANISGAVQAIPDTILPTLIGRRLGGAGLTKGISSMPTGAAIGMDLLGEGAGEVFQEYGKQKTLGYMNPNRDTSQDNSDLLNAGLGAMAGASPMSGASHMADAGYRRVGAGAQAGSQLVKDAAGTVTGLYGEHAKDTVDAGVEKAKGWFNRGKAAVEDLTPESVLEGMKSAAQDIGPAEKAKMDDAERAHLSGIPPADALSSKEATTKWFAENDAVRLGMIQKKLEGINDPTAQEFLSHFAAGNGEALMDDASDYILQHADRSSWEDHAANAGQVAGAVGKTIGRVATKAAKGAFSLGKDAAKGFVEGTKQGRKLNAQDNGSASDDFTLSDWRKLQDSLSAEPLAKGGSYNRSVEFARKAKLAGDYAADMAKRKWGTQSSVPKLARRLAFELADMEAGFKTPSAESPSRAAPVARETRLNRLTGDIRRTYGPQAEEVIDNLGKIMGPGHNDLTSYMQRELAEQNKPEGVRREQQRRTEVAQKLLAVIPDDKAQQLMDQGVNLRSPGAADHLLSTVEKLVSGYHGSSTPAFRKALEQHFGADAVSSMMDVMNDVDAQKQALDAPLVNSAEATTTDNGLEMNDDGEMQDAVRTTDGFEERDAEKNVSRGSGSKIYGFFGTRTLRDNGGGKDPFRPAEKITKEQINAWNAHVLEQKDRGEPVNYDNDPRAHSRPRLIPLNDERAQAQVTRMEKVLKVDQTPENMLRLLKAENKSSTRADAGPARGMRSAAAVEQKMAQAKIHSFALNSDGTATINGEPADHNEVRALQERAGKGNEWHAHAPGDGSFTYQRQEGKNSAQKWLDEHTKEFFQTRAGQWNVSLRSAHDVLTEQNAGPERTLSLYRDYLRQQAAKASKDGDKDGAKKLNFRVETIGRIVMDLMDGAGKAGHDGKGLRVAPEVRRKALRAAKEYFQAHGIVVAERLSDRDPNEISTEEVLALAKEGSKVTELARKNGPKAAFEANLLYFKSDLAPKKDDKSVGDAAIGKIGEIAVPAGRLVYLVRKKRNSGTETDFEDNEQDRSNKNMNEAYLNDVLQGISMLMASGHVGGLPTMRDAGGKAHPFRNAPGLAGVPEILRLATTNVKGMVFAKEQRQSKAKAPVGPELNDPRQHPEYQEQVAREQNRDFFVADLREEQKPTGYERRTILSDEELGDYRALKSDDAREKFLGGLREKHGAAWTEQLDEYGVGGTQYAEFDRNLDPRSVVRPHQGLTHKRNKTPLDMAKRPKGGRSMTGALDEYAAHQMDNALSSSDEVVKTRAYPKGRMDVQGAFHGKELSNLLRENFDAGAVEAEQWLRLAASPSYSKNGVVGGAHLAMPVAIALSADEVNELSAKIDGAELKHLKDLRAKLVQIVVDSDLSARDKLKIAKAMASEAMRDKIVAPNMNAYFDKVAKGGDPSIGLRSAVKDLGAPEMKDISAKPIVPTSRLKPLTRAEREAAANAPLRTSVGYERGAEVQAPKATSAPAPTAPAPAAKAATTLRDAIEERQDYVDNPPADYTAEQVQKHVAWAEKQLERVQAEYKRLEEAVDEKIGKMGKKEGVSNEDADRLDELSDLKSDLWRLIKDSKTSIEHDADARAIDKRDGTNLFGTTDKSTPEVGARLGKSQPPSHGGVDLGNDGPHGPKDQAKSDQATKFIGRGSPASSTAKYAKAWGARANTGSYTAEDKVFVSAEGQRGGRLDPDFAEIGKAVKAGATIITDDADNRKRIYNLGERQVAEFLGKQGYAEKSPGVWAPKVSARAESRIATLGHEIARLDLSQEDRALAAATDGLATTLRALWLAGRSKEQALAGDAASSMFARMVTAKLRGSTFAQELIDHYVMLADQVFAQPRDKNLESEIRTRLSSKKAKGELLSGFMGDIAGSTLPEGLKAIARAVGKVAGSVRVVRSSDLDGAEGAFNAAENRILVEGNEIHTAMAHTLLHEGVHAATMAAVVNNPELHRALYSLLAHVTAHDKQLASAYGASNTLEFLAEGLSNVGLQRRLYKISPNKTVEKYLGRTIANAWESFVTIVRKALNLSAAHDSALTQLLELGGRAMKETAATGSTVPHESMQAMLGRGVVPVGKLRSLADAIAKSKYLSDEAANDVFVPEAELAAITDNGLAPHLHAVAAEAMLQSLEHRSKKLGRQLTAADVHDLQADVANALQHVRSGAVLIPSRTHFNKQDGRGAIGKEATQKEMDEARAFFNKVLGPQVKVDFEKITGYSGEWIEAENVAKISTTAAAGTMQTTYHEALHAFFSKFVKSNPQAFKVLRTLAEDQNIIDRVAAQLADYPAALQQLRSSGEERLAYIYQFWAAGELDLPTRPATLFGKIRRFFRQVLGRITDHERAGAMLEAFHRGDFGKGPSYAGQAMNDVLMEGTMTRRALKKIDGAVQKVSAFVIPSHQMLLNSDSKEAQAIAKEFWSNPGDSGNNDGEGYLNARRSEAARYTNLFGNAITGLTDRDLKKVAELLQNKTLEGDIPYAPHKDAVVKIRALLGRFHKYMRDERNMDIGHIDEGLYFPRVWSVNQLMEKQGEFIDMLVSKYGHILQGGVESSGGKLTQQDVALRIWNAMANRSYDEKIAPSRDDGVLSPFFASKEVREMKWLDNADAEPFLNKDLIGTLTTYFHNGARAAEYTARFGPKGEHLDTSLKKVHNELVQAGEMKMRDGEIKDRDARNKWVERQMHNVRQAVGAMEGTIGKGEMSSAWRETSAWVTTYQNVRLLPMALFASVVDPLGMVARGATMTEAYETFLRAMKEVLSTWGDLFRDQPKERKVDEWEKLAMAVGSVDAAMFSHHVSDEYSSAYMGKNAKKVNDFFFKANGMEAMNRGMRVGATRSAVNFIQRHRTLPEVHSARWLKELELDPKKITVAADGNLILDKHDLVAAKGVSMQQAEAEIADLYRAINQWVEGAVLTPNAAQRPSWSSDPTWSVFFHLKQFSYSFHQTILKRAVKEMNYGNLAPIGAFAAYIPVMIASDIVKGLIQGGGELPGHMKGMDLGDHVARAANRAGLLGIGQLGVDAGRDIWSLGGPAVEQIVDGFVEPLSKMTLKALPVHGLYAEALK